MSSAAAKEEGAFDYPVIRLEAADFKDRLKKMKPFICTEETRYYLNGIYFVYDGTSLKATATNGHILCEMTIPFTPTTGKPFAVICPRKAVDDLIKILGKAEGAVSMSIVDEGRRIRFDFFDVEYFTKTIDGPYPDCTRIIPTGKDQMREGLNAGYLLSVLNALGNMPVDISVDDEAQAASSPHLLTSKQADGIKCVIMPMRV
jgi:DNA polymerase III sliding clamp (beta) subunit (PCNA family)